MSVTAARRGCAALVLALLVAGLSPVMSRPAGATDPVVEQGTPLPRLWEPELSVAPLWGGSPGYVMHDRHRSAEGDPTVLTVVRTGDGTVARTFTLGPRDSDPHLVGSSFVEEHFAGWSGPVDGVEVTDVETGLTRTIPVGSNQRLVRADEDWALVHTPEASGQRLQLVRPGGTITSVTGPLVTARVEYVGGDAHDAYVRDIDWAGNTANVYHVDVDTATVTALTEPSEGWGTVYVTPRRVISRTSETDVATGESIQRFSWSSRTSSASGVVEAPTPAEDGADRWAPFGDRLVLIDGPSSQVRHTLRPVDFTDGGYEPAIVTDVTDVQDLGDGRLALALADRPAGSIATVADDGIGPRHVAELPQIARRAAAPELNGAWVHSTFDGTDTTPKVTPSDGSGEWQEDVTPFTTAGDVTLTTSPPDADGHYVSQLTWPGGSRQFTDLTPMLGHGGLLVGVPVIGDNTTRWEVQEVRTGNVVADLPREPATPIAIDGTWVWTIPDVYGVMKGIDTSGAHADMRVPTVGYCFPPEHGDRYFDVRGRFAMFTCEQWRFYVVDTHQVVPPWTVTTDPQVVPKLGDGFLVAPRTVTAADGYTRTAVLDAWELTEQHAVHTYGPLRGASQRRPLAFEVDEADSRRALYVDPFGQPRMVDLGWVGTAPWARPDATSPTLTSEPDVPTVVTGSAPRAFEWSWAFEDRGAEFEPASGMDTYDVRVRTQTGPDRYGPWTLPDSWQGMTAASVSRSVAPSSGTCLAARARDKAGNVTPWSPQHCTFVDGGAPTLLPGRAAPRVVKYTSGSMSFGYRASDDYEVASYDVASRVAAAGQATYGTWRTIRRTTRTRLQVDVRPGSDWCFRFRARDTLGQTSSWSRPRCRAVPVDDGTYLNVGDALVGFSRRAIEHTYTELNLPNAYITFRRSAGRTLVLSVLRGPNQGAADVYFAGARLRRIRLGAPTVRQAFVTLPLPKRMTGSARVVAVGRRHVRVDAMAMLR